MRHKTLRIGLLLLGSCATETPSPPPVVEQPPVMEEKPKEEVPCAARAARVWKLTPDQFTNTVRALIPSAAQAGESLRASLSQTSGIFDNGAASLEMTQPHVDQLFETVREVAEKAAENPAQLSACLAGTPDRACVRGVIEDAGARGLRRPLTEDEIAGYLSDYDRNTEEHGARAGLTLFLRGLLLSPEFLYRTEIGPRDAEAPAMAQVVPMTQHERAAAISYLIIDGPPDADLRAAAAKGELETREQITAQARRLLSQPEAALGVDRLFTELLRLGEVPFMRKTKVSFPTYNMFIGADMAEETHRFIRHVLWQDGGKLGTLLNANYSIMNKRLADFYGLVTTVEGFSKVSYPEGQRAGLLTQGSLLGLLSNEIETSPVMRGKFIRERVLCQAIPPPPPTVNAVPPRADGMSTQRERLAQHSADQTCAGCHKLMDPMGLALESFDGVGLFRTTEYGKKIETAGTIFALRSGERSFADATELTQILSKDPQVLSCFAGTLFEFANGRRADSCEYEAVKSRFAKSGGDVLELMVSMVSAEGAFLRTRGGKE